MDRTEVGETLLVGMADLAVVQDQSAWLCTAPLGSCLAIAIFDPAARVAGVLNSILPEASIDPQRAATRPGMFLDSGLAALLEQAVRLGAKPERLVVCVAGGAQILDETSYFNIGNRNYAVLAGLLEQRGLRIGAQEVGGLSNRSLLLNTRDGEVRLKISGQAKMKVLCKP